MSSKKNSSDDIDPAIVRLQRMEAKLSRQREHERMNMLTREIEAKRLEMEAILKKRSGDAGFRHPPRPIVKNEVVEEKPMLSRAPPVITIDSDEEEPPAPRITHQESHQRPNYQQQQQSQQESLSSQEKSRILELEKQLAELKNAAQLRTNEFARVTQMVSMMAQGMPMNMQDPSTSGTFMNMSDEEFLEQQMRIRAQRQMMQQQQQPYQPQFQQTPRTMGFVPTPPSESPRSMDMTFEDMYYGMNPTKTGTKRKGSSTGSDNGNAKNVKISGDSIDSEAILNAQCSNCSMQFRSIAQLLNHRLASHGKDVMLKCTKCSGRFDTRREIHKHLNLEYGVFSCAGCGKNWSNNTFLQVHEKICMREKNEEENGKFKCSVCNQPHPSIEELLGHRQREHGLKIMLKCGICEKDFLSRSMIIRHLNIEYKLFPCKKCGNCLESEPDLVDHESFCEVTASDSGDQEAQNIGQPIVLDDLDVIEPQPAPMAMEISPRYNPNHQIKMDFSPVKRKSEISVPIDLKSHENTTDKNVIQCSKCSMIMWTINELLDHREQMHGHMDMLVCGICGEMFGTRKDILRHLNVEYGIFGCVNCERRAKDKTSMENHERGCLMAPMSSMSSKSVVTQPKTKRNNVALVCNSCELATMSPSILEHHEPNCKGKRNVRIECSICKCDFRTIRELLDHRHGVHGEQTMLQCGFCLQSFTRRDAIANHLNVEYRFYTCLKCDQPFLNQYAVFEHEKLCNDEGDGEETFNTGADVSDVGTPNGTLPTFSSTRACQKCGRKSGCVEYMQFHESKCEGPMFVLVCDCDLCEASYPTVVELLCHREKDHGHAIMLQCPKCQRTFNTRKGMRAHLTSEFGAHTCMKCGKHNQSTWALMVHEKGCMKNFQLTNNSDNSNSGGNQAQKAPEKVESQKIITPKEPTISKLKYKCERCGKFTSLKYVIDAHEKECTGAPPVIDIKCNLCSAKFSSVLDLTSHRAKTHGPVAAKTCGVCDKVVESKHGMTHHLNIEYSAVTCMKCGKPQGGNYQLLDHEKRCGKSESEGLTCCKCNKKSFSMEIMGEHEKNCDGETVEQKDIQCILCYEKFINVPSLLTHLIHNHCEDAMLTCGICERKFESKNGIWGHLNIEYRVFPCLRCDKPQMSLTKLYDHEKTCKPTFEVETANLVQCGRCLKIGFMSTWARDAFDEHEENCTGEKNENDTSRDIECIICNESFFTIQDIVTHRQRMHGEDSMMDCPICGVKYESRTGLLAHLALEYGVFQCSKCKKPCVSMSKKNEHEKSCKEDLANFMMNCEKCEKYSHKKEDLEKHIESCEGKDETEVKCIECTICHLKFINVSSLVTHLSKVHGDEAMLTCGICNRRMDTRHGIVMHLSLEYSTHVCSKCGKPQRTAKTLEDHEKSCNFQNAMTCNSCEKETFVEERLEQHKANCKGKEEEEKEPSVKCESCMIHFITVYDYLTHRQQNHGGDAAMLKCDFCQKKFGSKSGISSHLNLEFGLYVCSNCGKTCRSGYDLNEHSSKCNGFMNKENDQMEKDSELMVCEKCVVKTYSTGVYEDHVEICDGTMQEVKEKIPTCHLCPDDQERFFTARDLITHREKFHEEEYWYNCHFCGMNCDNKRAIVTHLIGEYGSFECSKCFRHHYSCNLFEEHEKECNVAYMEEPASCEKCGKWTYKSDTMENHLLTGCEENQPQTPQISCQRCDSMAFFDVNDLLHHRQQVHGEGEMLKCEKCEKKFGSRTGIHWHLNYEYELFKCKYCQKKLMSSGFVSKHEKHCKKIDVGEGANDTKTKEDVLMSCKRCGISSFFKNLLVTHEEECDGSPTLTRGGKEISCSICFENYLTVPDLIHHRKDSHGEEAMLECGVCEKKFLSKSVITTHSFMEYGVHACIKCGIVLVCKSKRIEHEKACKRRSLGEQASFREEVLETMVQCEKCNKGTFLQSKMDLHMKSDCQNPNQENEVAIDEVAIVDEKVKYQCNLCPTNLMSLKDLLTHRQREHGEKVMLQCLFCDKNYETKSGIIMHLALEYKLYPCPGCGKYLSSTSLLKNHRSSCKKNILSAQYESIKQELPDPTRCSHCEKWMYDEETLKKHEGRCLEELADEKRAKSKDMVCDGCDMVWITPYDYLTHRRDKHGVEAMLTCVNCGKKFESRDLILKHVQFEYELYKCRKCEKALRSAKDLQNHMAKCRERTGAEVTEEKVVEEFSCDNCSIISFEKELMNEHREKCLTNTLETGKITIECNLCQKKFLSPYDVWFHRREVHGHDVSLTCTKCDRQFEDRKIIMAHLNIEYEFFKCRRCGRPLTSKNRRSIHEATCTKGGNEKVTVTWKEKSTKNEENLLMREKMNEEGSFDCENCGRRTYNAKYWKEHLNGCDGVKEDAHKIDCSLCDAKYLNISDLLTHRNNAHGAENMLRCGVCGKQSNSKALIYSHLTMEYSIFKCNNCSRCFESGQKLDEHKERCDKAADSTMLSGNDTTMGTLPSENEDTRMEVDQAEGVFECANCHRMTENEELFNGHEENCKDDENMIKFDCWSCDGRFLSVVDLVNHGMKVHGEDEGRKCGFCKRKVYSKDMMVNHLTIEFQVNKCEKCSRCFVSCEKLEEHKTKCT